MPTSPHQVRTRVLEWARTDPRVTGAALTGSAAAGTEDAWSDVDLFLGVSEATPAEVLQDLSAYAYAELGAVHHFDLLADPAVYRAFLLVGPLELDVGLTPAAEFGSHGGAPFRVVFGTAGPPTPARGMDVAQLIGRIWHHLLHARSAIGRDRLWAAEYWVSQTRSHLLTLAAVRHGLDPAYARGAHGLPAAVTGPLEWTLVAALDRTELTRALAEVTSAAIRELGEHDPVLTARLVELLVEPAD